MPKKLSLAIVGATGLVGRTMREVLEERDICIDKFYVFASARSAGKKITFKGEEYEIEELKEDSFDRGIDVALFAAGGAASLKYAPIAAAKGCTVVDNSSVWRMDETVPLVVPEINPEDVEWSKGIIANPNCSTIQAVVALNPIHKKYGIKRIVYSTYQSASGAAQAGWNDLEAGLKGIAPTTLPHPIAHNCIPHIDVFTDSGYTKEELKMVNETRKILHAPELRITATTVRVPVFRGHSESINVELSSAYELNELIELLENAPGIVVQNDFAKHQYPMPIYAEGSDMVYVGRIRRDDSIDSGVNLWVVSDNLRKGAATNAVQIAELLMKEKQ